MSGSEGESKFMINKFMGWDHYSWFYSQTGKTVEHQKRVGNVIVLHDKSQSGVRKLNCKQER